MKLQQTQCSVTKVITYSDSVSNFLKTHYNEETEKMSDSSANMLGGVLSDVNYTWVSNGPRLEVLSSKTGNKVAAWTFGAVLRDSYTKVTCVVDLPTVNSNAPLLVVGLQSGISRGMVCVFDVRSSKVLRAIHIDRQVTSIHVVDAGCDSPLPGALRALDGILAVGTNEGKILLIDLCRQACDEAINSCNTDYIRDEVTACDIVQLEISDLPMLEKHKEHALKTGDHLCIQLNESCTRQNFILKGPDGGTRLGVNIVEVKISALHYCPQLGSLLVGYNFGAFQLYNLLSIKLEYTSPVYEEYIPVSHFAIQEPCDDPRAFCYIWVMYSNLEIGIPGFPVAVMYALAYNAKDYLEGYGYLYQELTSCSIRFQTDLTALPGSKVHKPTGANCISLTAYTKSNHKNSSSSMQDLVEDRLALCAVVWAIWNAAELETYMCLFDLNQWYKEQMPSSPKADDNGSYMVFLSLTDLFVHKTSYNSNILDVKLEPKSISQFSSAQRLEEHYFPNALAYKLICAREDDIIWVNSPGIQRYLLSRIELAGPLCLLRPTDIFNQCLHLGLTPLYSDINYNDYTSIPLQREMILSVALEHQLISWLCSCAQQWSNGSHSSDGCTLQFLIKWAWQRANTLKANANELCEPLFDYSGIRLDQNTHMLLNHCTRQLKHLASLYGHIANHCVKFLADNYIEEIQHQFKALKMLSVYLEVLQWLLNVGLLPECPLYMYPRPDETERISAPYPVESLTRFYKDRRSELFELQGIDDVKDTESCDLLFIDNLIDLECGGALLRSEWQADGGSGLYPPPSLQSLLRTYLVEDVDMELKHCIFIYVFLDLAMTLDQSRYTPIITHLIKFPAVFNLSNSIIKMTQAFWQLDHGDFSTAMAQLLDPLVSNEDLQPWHHRVAVKALLAQGQHQHALLYHQVRQPPTLDLQDLCITITLLIVNDLLQEAFHFQRQNRSECNEKELLHHFMEACDKTNQLVNILQLPLIEVEEQALVKYLEENRRPDTENYLVLYYLQRSRFAEAFENNDKLNGEPIGKQGLVGELELNSRNSLVRQCKNSLPFVMQDLLNHHSTQKPNTWQSVDRPCPMSVYVHDSQDKMKYKSTLIQASLLKARETWAESSKSSSDMPFMSTPKLVVSSRQRSTSIIYPSIINSTSLGNIEEEFEDGPTPCKRQRISPRQPIGLTSDRKEKFRNRTVSAKSILLLSTPIVKRKSVRSRSVSSTRMLESFTAGSPQSILKVRKLVRKSTSPIDRCTPEKVEHNFDDDLQPIDRSAAEKIKSTFINLANYSVATPGVRGISPRRSIQRTSRQGVRFQDSHPSSPSSQGSIERMEVDIPIESQNSNILQNTSDASKNSSVEERFYSPDASLENKTGSEEADTPSEKVMDIPIVIKDETVKVIPSPRNTRKRKISENSVKSRRSYKLDVSQAGTPDTSIVSQPILETPPGTSTQEIPVIEISAAETSVDAFTDTSNVDTLANISSEPQTHLTPRKQFPKVTGRKSLTRKVLEQNTFAKALSSSRMQTRMSTSKKEATPETKNAIGFEMKHSKTTMSVVKKIDGKVTEDTSSTQTSESKNIFTTEVDPVTSEQIIKHIHNESLNKSSTKLTEVLDDSEMSDVSSVDHILTRNSDVDDSFLVKYVYDKQQTSQDSISTSFDKHTEYEDTEEDSEIFEQPKEEETPKIIIHNIEIEGEQPSDTIAEKGEIINIDMDNIQTAQLEITGDLTEDKASSANKSPVGPKSNVIIKITTPGSAVCGDVFEVKSQDATFADPNFEEEHNILSRDSSVDEDLLDIDYADRSQTDESQENIEDGEESVGEESSSGRYIRIASERTKLSASGEETTEEEAEETQSVEELESDQEESDEKEENVTDEESLSVQAEDSQTTAEREENDSIEEIEDEEKEEVEEEEDETSEEEKQSDEEIESETESADKVIEIPSSSDDEVEELKMIVNPDSDQESSSSVNILEKNINESSVSSEMSHGYEKQTTKDSTVTEKDETGSEKESLGQMETDQKVEESGRMKAEEIEENVDEGLLQSQGSSTTQSIPEVTNTSTVSFSKLTKAKKGLRASQKSVTPDTGSQAPEVSENVSQTSKMEATQSKTLKQVKKTFVSIEEKSKRSTRASSLTPTTRIQERDTEKRKKRGQSADVEVLRSLQAKSLGELKKQSLSEVIIEEKIESEDTELEETNKPSTSKAETEASVRRTRRSVYIVKDSEEKKAEGDIDKENKEKKSESPAKKSDRSPSREPEDKPKEHHSPYDLRSHKAHSEDINKQSTKAEAPVKVSRNIQQEFEEENVEISKTDENEEDTPLIKRIVKSHLEKVTSEHVKSPATRRSRRTSVQADESVEEVGSPLPTRRGRRPSTQSEEQVPEETGTPTPVRRGRKSSVQPEDKREGSPSPEKITRTRRLSVQSTEQDTETKTQPKRRGRRSSVQSESAEEVTEPAVRITRRTSMCSDDQSPAAILRERRSSIQSEEGESKTPQKGRRRTSTDSESVTSKSSTLGTIEDYAATHRLTRRQKIIMEKNMELLEKKKEMDKKRLAHFGKLDPINLMDKDTFAGEPDPEENRPHSPTSSIITVSSVGTRTSARLQNKHQSPDGASNPPSLPGTPQRKRRSVSTASQKESPTSEDKASVHTEESDEHSTGRTKRRSFTAAQQALMSSPAARKKRKLSQDSDVSETTSITSVVSAHVESTKSSELETMRHRSLSPTLLKAGQSTESPVSKGKKKGRTSILPKVELTKITEEASQSTNISADSEKTPLKRGRWKMN